MADPLPSAVRLQKDGSLSRVPGPRGRILIVDDEPALLRAWARTLMNEGYQVETVADGRAAAEIVGKNEFDVILSDITMPGMNGLELLRVVRARDLDVPVVLATADPAVETAVQALEFGAFRYLTKPVDSKALVEVIAYAVRLHQMAKIKRQAAAVLGFDEKQVGDRAGLEASFGRALSGLWMAYQPIVSWSKKSVFAHEALLRTNEPTLPHPGAVLDAAEKLGRLDDVGRSVRDRVGATIAQGGNGLFFVNLHTRDLLDESLYAPTSSLTRVADRVVLEITERAALHQVKDVRGCIGRLRGLGFRVAVDDLGAGYAGLTSFASLEPEVVKLDMSLVRDVHKVPVKQKLVHSMAELCKEMGLLVVAEGVETPEERDVIVATGIDLLQGYLFAKPAPPFPAVRW